MTALSITIPLPPKGCAQNTHAHWRVRHQANARHRQEASMAALALTAFRPFPVFVRATVAATFYCGPNDPRDPVKRYRPLDSTNAAASLKAAIDGLVDAHVFPADDHRTLRMMPPVLLRTKKEHQGRAEVVLEVTEWE